MPAAYGGDGSGDVPAGGARPSPREISNAVHAQAGSVLNPASASDYLWQWGQFIDHDVIETPLVSPSESFDIPVPANDMFFDPYNTGAATIPLDRSSYDLSSGVRQQMNFITAYIDGSAVYGSEEERTEALRAHDGSGRLLESAGRLMPFNTDGLHNAMSDDDPTLFLAGDIRANEQLALAAMHTLWVREHNWWADRLNARHPEWDGDKVFEHARAMVAAEMQAITYNEWLPLLLGPGAIPPYTGYKPQVNAGVSNVFGAAAFRVGHTMLSPELKRLGPDMEPIPGGNISLADAFFNPSELVATGIEPLLRGLASQEAQAIDRFVVDEVRNFLFGPPGAGGLDLASLNIQRGRDHGLPSYNEIRVRFGLAALGSFADMPAEADAKAALASVYATVHDIDAWSGMLSERNAPGALVGETIRAVLVDQFTRLRDGDRFWYASYLPPELVAEVNGTRLSRVIRRNTSIGGELQANVFMVPAECLVDMDRNGVLNSIDISRFVNAFLAGMPAADMNDDMVLNASDIMLFVNTWLQGCG